MKKNVQKDNHKTLNTIKKGFIFYTLCTLVIATGFAFYMQGNPLIERMNTGGWVFFLTSCISHAAQFALIPYLLFIILTLCHLRKVAWAVMQTTEAFLVALNYLNMQVYSIYRFHINGMILSMVFGESAGDIFKFSPVLIAKEIGLFLLLAAIIGGLAFTSVRVFNRTKKAYALPVTLAFIGCLLTAHGMHIYGKFYRLNPIVKSARLLPYYFPTSANRQLLDWGYVQPMGNDVELSSGDGDLSYPMKPLKIAKQDSLPNILVLMVDSWNTRSLTEDCMPNTYTWAKENLWFKNHRSGSNGTRTAVFSFFFGIPGYYFEACDDSNTRPLLITELLRQGYECQIFPSASIYDPPFGRVVFRDIPNLRTETPGNNTMEKDSCITHDFIGFLDTRDTTRPFFSFLFYDMPHNFDIDKAHNTHHTPAWDYADYADLTNDLDPTAFFNLYRNTCHYDDVMLGRVFDALRSRHLLDNTIVVLTGDHGQEFNENKKNYWGHNSNFSQWQNEVPMVVHIPGAKAREYTHRTTHYDIVPTLMPRLGVQNPAEDYSLGHEITDTTSRFPIIVGSNLNYAFIIPGDTILEKTNEGDLDVFDSKMNPIENYHIRPAEFNEATRKLNSFFK